MLNPIAVANWFVDKGIKTPTRMTQMKLQKLIYFAHGWHLGIYRSPLVSDSFQAWKYGPVIPSVYFTFREEGVADIKQLGQELSPRGAGLESIVPLVSNENSQALELLERIWAVYGAFTGNQLSDMTHAVGTPWSLVRIGYPENTYNIPIPNSIIEAYFKARVREASA